MSVCWSGVPYCFDLAPELSYFRPLAQGRVPVGRGRLLAMRSNRNMKTQ